MKATELQIGHYYFDCIYNSFLIYDGEENGYYWFILSDESRHVAYYEWELDNLREY